MYHTKQTVFDTNCRPVHVNAESFFNHVFSYTDISFYRYGLLNWTYIALSTIFIYQEKQEYICPWTLRMVIREDYPHSALWIE